MKTYNFATLLNTPAPQSEVDRILGGLNALAKLNAANLTFRHICGAPVPRARQPRSTHSNTPRFA